MTVFRLIGALPAFLAVLPFFLLVRFEIRLLTHRLPRPGAADTPTPPSGAPVQAFAEALPRTLACWLFALALAGMLAVTGVPSLGQLAWDVSLNRIPFTDILRSPAQYAQNLILFVPLGFLLPLLWPEYESPARTALSGLVFSGAIEFAQLFCFRATDIDDLLMNTLGAAAGWALWALAGRLWPGGLKPGKQRKRRRGDLENPERRRRRLKQAKMLLMAGEGKAIFSLRPGLRNAVDCRRIGWPRGSQRI